MEMLLPKQSELLTREIWSALKLRNLQDSSQEISCLQTRVPLGWSLEFSAVCPGLRAPELFKSL